MQSNEAVLARLKEKEATIKEAIHYTDLALASDEYTKPFSFRNENSARAEDFKHEFLERILNRLEQRKLGFDPDLTIQHIEKECLDQFNEIVTTELKGKSVVDLMAMKHELELTLLKERKIGHAKALEKVQKEILEVVTPTVSLEEPTPIKSEKKITKK